VVLPTNSPVSAIASLNSGTEGSLSMSPAGDALVFMGDTNTGAVEPMAGIAQLGPIQMLENSWFHRDFK
jgi:hypothetical protein